MISKLYCRIVENLNNLVDETIRRNNMILNYKFNTMLEEAKGKVKKLEGKIKDTKDLQRYFYIKLP